MNTSNKSDKYWKDKLTEEQYKVLRQSATEAPFSGQLLHNKKGGMYQCAACGADLFSSTTKFDSGSGWPSFFDVVNKGNVKLVDDNTLGMRRVEVQCASCGGHLGHLFDDGPTTMSDGSPCTGNRYCINSAALNFKEHASTT